MRVLAWKSYGSIRVFNVDDDPQGLATLARLVQAVNGWELNNELDALGKVLLAAKTSKLVESSLRGFVKWFCSDHEQFESFEFCTVES